jgi:predicted metal-dependent HD superfamily phosphohydrolase
MCDICKTHLMCCLHMICHRHINCVLQISHAYICLVTDISIVSYRHHTPTYVLSQTQQLCLTEITHLHMSSNGHISCVLQISHAYKYLVTDTAIVSYRHHTPTCKTQLLCLWQDICRCVISVRHIWCVWYDRCRCVMSISHNGCVCEKTCVGVWCL